MSSSNSEAFLGIHNADKIHDIIIIIKWFTSSHYYDVSNSFTFSFFF